MPKAKSDKKKRCWCTPYCGKLRTARARRNHYSQLTKEQLKYKADSETELEDYNDKQNSNKPEQHHSQNLHDASSDFKLNTNGTGELSEADMEQQQGQRDGRTVSMADDNSDTSIGGEVLDSKSEKDVEVSRLPIYVGIGGNDDGIEFDSENDSFNEFDIWARYDEAEELMARMSEVERLRHFDEMMKASEDAECWGGRMCHLSMFHACYLIKYVRT